MANGCMSTFISPPRPQGHGIDTPSTWARPRPAIWKVTRWRGQTQTQRVRRHSITVIFDVQKDSTHPFDLCSSRDTDAGRNYTDWQFRASTVQPVCFLCFLFASWTHTYTHTYTQNTFVVRIARDSRSHHEHACWATAAWLRAPCHSNFVLEG